MAGKFRARRRRCPNRQRSRDWYERIVANSSDREFKENFRVSRPTFRKIVNEIAPHLKGNSVHCSGNAVSPRKRDAIAIYTLGSNAEYRTIGNLFGVHKSTVCTILHEVCSVVESHLLKQYVKLPDRDGFASIAAGFYRKNGFPCVVGAIDGSHIPIRAPERHPEDYVNRKSWHSVVLQALTDDHCMFLDVYCGWPGSVHDARVFSNSPLFGCINSTDALPVAGFDPLFPNLPPVVLGDSAYPLLTWLLKPFRRSHAITNRQKEFNYRLR